VVAKSERELLDFYCASLHRKEKEMRFRKDVKPGMLIVKNKCGWFIPLSSKSVEIGQTIWLHDEEKRQYAIGFAAYVNKEMEALGK